MSGCKRCQYFDIFNKKIVGIQEGKFIYRKGNCKKYNEIFYDWNINEFKSKILECEDFEHV